MNGLSKRIKINNTEYYVIEETKEELCILQTFNCADGVRRQQKIWVLKIDKKQP